MSIIRQQRWLSFAAGGAVATAFYISLQRDIWGQTSKILDAMPQQAPLQPFPRVTEPMFGPHFRGYLTRQWNATVDAAFQPVIRAVSNRGL